MLHKVAGKKLGRNKNQRTSLFRNLANQLILHEKIITTEAKAKAVKPMVEKLITKAKSDTLHTRRLLIKKLVSRNTVKKMLEVIGPKFKNRSGGYTKIIKLGRRVNDSAPMVALLFVEDVSSLTLPEKKEVKKEVKASVDPDTKKEKTKRTKITKAKKVEDGKK